jgi:hypothetical protein
MKWPCTVYCCWFRTSYTNLIILSSNRQYVPENDTARVQCFPTPRSLFRGAGCASIILLTPRSTFLLENLSSLTRQKFPLIYGHRMLMTVFTIARHLSLQYSSRPRPTSWKSFLILSTHLHLRLQSCLFPSRFSTKTLCTNLLSYVRATWPAHLTVICLITRKIFCRR